ncbi:hypothetical protein TNCV_1080051 [Trichonephila clavipes]|nr:hypothetical protein TNCV_1080051 [Trichonephila clavipes]
MSRFGGLSEGDLQCLRPQASLVLIYQPNVAGMKGRVDLAQPVNRTPDLWCGSTIHSTTRPYSVKNKTYPVHSENRMMVENLTEGFSLIEQRLQILENIDSNNEWFVYSPTYRVSSVY